jgi:hypothetical protein
MAMLPTLLHSQLTLLVVSLPLPTSLSLFHHRALLVVI